jgi:hypothetical protein
MQSTRREFDFPVVGTSHIKGAYDLCLDAYEGIPLDLERDPHNPYDVFAINVLLDGKHIGYVPNKGYSCMNCWSPIDPKFYICRTCGSDGNSFCKGGLATRLQKLGLLDKEWACVVQEMNQFSTTTPITAKLIIAEGPVGTSI